MEGKNFIAVVFFISRKQKTTHVLIIRYPGVEHWLEWNWHPIAEIKKSDVLF